MIKLTNNILLALVFVGLGGIGGWFVRDWFCADSSEQIVTQLEDDAKEIEKVRKQIEVKYVYRDKIKTVVREIAAPDECFDSAIPDRAADLLRESFNGAGSPTD